MLRWEIAAAKRLDLTHDYTRNSDPALAMCLNNPSAGRAAILISALSTMQATPPNWTLVMQGFWLNLQFAASITAVVTLVPQMARRIHPTSCSSYCTVSCSGFAVFGGNHTVCFHLMGECLIRTRSLKSDLGLI